MNYEEKAKKGAEAEEAWNKLFADYCAKFPAPPASVLPQEYECAATIFPADTLTTDSLALEGFSLEEDNFEEPTLPEDDEVPPLELDNDSL